jgi:O-antigen/teichoic acid export membrane protein
MYAARYLGPANYGIINFAIAFTGIFSILADFGLQQITVRDVSKNKALALKYITNVSLLKLILAIVTYGLIALTVNLLGYPLETVQVVYLLGLSVVFSAISAVMFAISQAYERMELQAIGQIISTLISVCVAIVAVKCQWSLVQFVTLYAISSFGVLLYSLAIVRWGLKYEKAQEEPYRPRLDWQMWKDALKNAWPIGIATAIGVLYSRIDVLMLQAMKGDSAVGLYSAARGLMELTFIIPGMLMVSVFPLMCQYYASAHTSLNVAYQKSIKYLFAVALPMALLVTILAGNIIVLIYGDKFFGAADALRVLIWAAVLIYINSVVGSMYIATNRQRTWLILIIIALVSNVLLNLALIPRLSYIGASATRIFNEALGLVIGLYIFHRMGHKLNMMNVFLPPVLAFMVAGAVSILLIKLGVNIYIVSAAVLLIYAALVYLLGIKKDDKQLIKSLFAKHTTSS